MFGSTSGFHLFATLGVGICSAALLFIIRDPKTPKWLDVATAIALLLLAALFLGMIQSIFASLPGDTFEERDLKNQYQVALYLVPFFSAGLATNLLSNVILSNRDYTGTMTFYEAAKATIWGIWFAFLTITVFGLLLYVIYKTAMKKTSKEIMSR